MILNKNKNSLKVFFINFAIINFDYSAFSKLLENFFSLF